MLNIIIHGILEKRRCEKKGSQGDTQNPNAPNRGIITKWKQKTLRQPQKIPNNTLVGLNHKAYQF
jgi:hypothetical protein